MNAFEAIVRGTSETRLGRGRALGMSLVLAVSLAACGKSESPSQPAEAAPAATSAEPEKKERLLACDLVTQAEMSAIVGGAVVAQRNDRSNGKTECVYSAAEGISPYVEFTVEWGSGEGAMMGLGLLNKKEPGITSPYDGIGDQAVAVGPALMIRTGEDLITIVFSGVDDAPEKARRIFDTAKARM